jgi:hypothetical protein
MAGGVRFDDPAEPRRGRIAVQEIRRSGSRGHAVFRGAHLSAKRRRRTIPLGHGSQAGIVLYGGNAYRIQGGVTCSA